MADAQFAGIVAGNQLVEGLANIQYAIAGYQFDHATQAGNFGLRTDASALEIKAVTVTDTRGREAGTHAFECEIKAELLQSRITTEIQNLYYLSKQEHQLIVRTSENEYFNFINNAGTLAVPTGSRYVGCKWKLLITDTERKIEVTWRVRLTPLEHDWLLANTGAASTGGSSGTFTGLVAGAYNRSAGFKIANFDSVLVNGNNVGVFESPKLEIEAIERSTKDGQFKCRQLKVSAEVTCMQTAPLVELQAGRTMSKNDYSFRMNTNHSEVFIFNAGALSLIPETMIGDKDRGMKILATGMFPMTPLGVEFATDTMTFSLTGYA